MCDTHDVQTYREGGQGSTGGDVGKSTPRLHVTGRACVILIPALVLYIYTWKVLGLAFLPWWRFSGSFPAGTYIYTCTGRRSPLSPCCDVTGRASGGFPFLPVRFLSRVSPVAVSTMTVVRHFLSFSLLFYTYRPLLYFC